MPGGRKKGQKTRGVDSNVLEATPEDLRIEIDQIFNEFMADPRNTEYIFTSELSNLQRRYIHNKAQKLNIVSKSSGREPNRTLRLKKRPVTSVSQPIYLHLSDASKQRIEQFIANSGNDVMEELTSVPKSHWRKGIIEATPSVPLETCVNVQLYCHRQSLPIYVHREEILDSIEQNRVTILSAETGSGKTTQVPQYILEQYGRYGKQCRILCTQPRRIAAIAAAERVAAERGEKLGSTVGFIVRLDQTAVATTNLIYCTTGVFLRQLMTSSNALKNVTHVLIDEIHERDKDTDFILTCLKISLGKYPHLKLVLMSATFNAEFFLQYFGDGNLLYISGRVYNIHTFFLPQTLAHLKYMSSQMTKLKLQEDDAARLKKEMYPDVICDPPTQAEVDQILDFYRDNNNELYDNVEQFKYFVNTENLPVDTPHSKTGQTALMLAAERADMGFITFLLEEGADLDKPCHQGMTALDYSSGDDMREDLLDLKFKIENRKLVTKFQKDAENYHRLYDKSFNGEVDFALIVALVKDILTNCASNGAILVFLPGYEDIMICSEYITNEVPDETKYKLFFLHSSINIQQQSEVFKASERRKIILATNIAETSITIDDVVYVIDTGKVKEKSFDYFANASSLRTVWISQASAEQRRGRAGRTGTGTCFRLYSMTRYMSMEKEKAPEMLRVSLEELCLHTKVVAPIDQDIADFLEMAPSPPLRNRINVAIENLVGLGALDEVENLTILGEYLSVLPLEPHFGKMIIFAIIFKCLDPMLILTAAMSNQDPFDLPQKQILKAGAEERRKQLIDGVLSDHIAYLEAYKLWEKSGDTDRICYEFYISSSAMSFIKSMKQLLVKQLIRMGFIDAKYDLQQYNINSDSWPVVKAALCTGLFPNVAIMRQPPQWLIKDTHKVSVPRTSACNTCPKNVLLIYDEVFCNRVLTIKGLTAVTPVTIALVCGSLMKRGTTSFQINGMNFKFWQEDFLKFRELLDELVQRVLICPQYSKYNDRDIGILRTVRAVLEEEELTANLKTPKDMPSASSWETIRHRGQRNQAEQDRGGPSWRAEDPSYRLYSGARPSRGSRSNVLPSREYEETIRELLQRAQISRGGPSNAQRSRGGPSRGGPSNAQRSRGGPSNAQSSRGGPSNAQSSRGYHSSAQTSRGSRGHNNVRGRYSGGSSSNRRGRGGRRGAI